MVYRYVVVALFVVQGLVGCAVPQLASEPLAALWQDQAFGYQSALVTETLDTVFALDPALEESLRAKGGVARSMSQRLDMLVSRLYDPKGLRLSYASGRTTNAAETWRNQSGDCLSLTILAYASARFLGINAYMQEVPVPVAFDRRGGVDFINGHVNLMVRHAHELSVNGRMVDVENFVVDFEPQLGSHRFGQKLSESDVMARYYNNRAVEYLVQQDDARAYAYFRAAIMAAPDYAPAFTNLAQLYIRLNLFSGAEKLLVRAIALAGPSQVPLQSMHKLLVAQGRSAEAQKYAELLAKKQDENPYHWMGLGMTALQDGRYGSAIRALERAAALSNGFEEIHYYLALAYWRDGQHEAARKQLLALSAINQQAPGVAALSKKFSSLAPKSAVY